MRVPTAFQVTPGLRVGHYLLESLLYEDDVSSVWQAKGDDGQRYAIRFFPATPAAPPVFSTPLLPDEGPFTQAVVGTPGPDRFRHISERLRHRHIVPIVEVGEYAFDDNVSSLYIVAQLYTLNLHQFRIDTASGGLTEETALRLIKQIAYGVAQMHRQQVVHGRLSLRHILLDNRQNAFVCGFDVRLAQPQSVVAPPSRSNNVYIYAAPEVRQGNRPTPASDVYAMACMLIEMLAGQEPVGPHPEELLARIRVSRATREVIARALRHTPDTTTYFADAQEFLEALPLYLNVPGIDQPTRRASPSFDPLVRLWFSGMAKWGVLFGLLCLVVWLPTWLMRVMPPTPTDRRFYIGVVICTAILAAVAATAVPRVIEGMLRFLLRFLLRIDISGRPPIFGCWREPVEAARDWLLVGIVTGGLYWGILNLLWAGRLGPSDVVLMTDWWRWRFPFVLISGALGAAAARIVTIRGEDVSGNSFLATVIRLVIQAGIIGGIYRSLHDRMILLSKYTNVGLYAGWAGLELLVLSFAIVLWALLEDLYLIHLQRQGKASATAAGIGPVNMVLTVIGGTQSGKTAFLTGAYREWTTNHLGPLEIRAVNPPTGNGNVTLSAPGGAEDLDERNVLLNRLGRSLYDSNDPDPQERWPRNTVRCEQLAFDIYYDGSCVAQFTLLDYPGGATVGNAPVPSLVQEFWNRVPQTDGLILVADMSFVRRDVNDPDFGDVMKAYRRAMNLLVERNGKRRVIPMALVLTKCDEYADAYTRTVNREAMGRDLARKGYSVLERTWRDLNARRGPAQVEYTVWPTSSITHSRPDRGPNGQEDTRLPYVIRIPAPPSVRPDHCAAPLLWLTAKVMRWNITLFRDFAAFILGPAPAARRHIEAIEEMERLAQRLAEGDYSGIY